MAMPFIIHHNESIYNVCIEEKDHSKLTKSVRHSAKPLEKSRKNGDGPINGKKSAHHHKTMGYAEVPLQLPQDYLKIGGGHHSKRIEKDHKCYRRIMPPIPKRQDLKAAETKNFKTANIETISKMTPKRTEPRYVDTKKGDYHDLRKSGLMPAYIYQPKFGKLPKYLINRIREVGRQEEMYRDEVAGSNQPLCRYVTQEERAELLGGLKYNWEELQQTYQGLPVLTDTIPKAIRKTNLENQLKQLEKDIMLVENHPYIYVYANETN